MIYLQVPDQIKLLHQTHKVPLLVGLHWILYS